MCLSSLLELVACALPSREPADLPSHAVFHLEGVLSFGPSVVFGTTCDMLSPVAPLTKPGCRVRD